MTKPNCYECKWRKDIMGDCHSKCAHPKALIDMLSSMAQGTPLPVTANPHGIKNGWFYWPMNFDPVWLETCERLEKK
jgi:hypothetical protein